MKLSRWPIVVVGLLLAACGAPATQPLSAPGNESATSLTVPETAMATVIAEPTATPAPLTTTFDAARSVGLATSEDGALLVVLGMNEALFVTRSEDRGKSFSTPIKVTGEVKALVSRLERPALATGSGGRVVVSWLEMTETHETRIWYTRSEDNGRRFTEPMLVGRSQAHETTMVRAALAAQGTFLSWLQDGALQLVHDKGQAEPEALVVDHLVCDCCQPSLLVGERLLIAYRNVEQLNGDTTRDMYVAASTDGGVHFEKPVRVSDAPWYLNACPISGPAIAGDSQHVYVAWMDGRADDTGTGARGDVWIARSDDGGRSFGANVRVNPREEGYHNLPTLVVDSTGRLHIAWEAVEGEQAHILYSTSTDAGLSFAPPRSIVLETDKGRPSQAALVAHPDGLITIAWVDRGGAHVMVGL
jgi:hypothetical protein